MTQFLPRSAWTDTAPGGDSLNAAGVVGIAVHYPGDGDVTYAGLSQAEVAQKLNGYRDYHMNHNGWSDIGYNIAVDQSGRAWDCRWPGRIGAQCDEVVDDVNENERYIGVLFIVGNNEPLTSAAVQAFKDVHNSILQGYPNATQVLGHQQVPENETDCPGPQILSALAAGTLTGGGSAPAPAPASDWDGHSYPGPDAFVLGQSNPAVTTLGQRLIAHGFGGRYTQGPGPVFTETDLLSTQDFQLAQGWTGSDADGYPGPTTWDDLMATPTASLSKVVSAAESDPDRPQGGQTDGAVLSVHVVEAALEAEGLLSAEYAYDGSFGSSSVTAYSGWQKRCGYSGADADGIPGQQSLTQLGSKHGFTVTS